MISDSRARERDTPRVELMEILHQEFRRPPPLPAPAHVPARAPQTFRQCTNPGSSSRGGTRKASVLRCWDSEHTRPP